MPPSSRPTCWRPARTSTRWAATAPARPSSIPTCCAAAHVVVEYEPQTRIEGDIQQMPPSFPVTELWRVLPGQAPGRQHDDQWTVFDSVGFALEDFSALRWLRDSARELGLGTPTELVPALPTRRICSARSRCTTRASAVPRSTCLRRSRRTTRLHAAANRPDAARRSLAARNLASCCRGARQPHARLRVCARARNHRLVAPPRRPRVAPDTRYGDNHVAYPRLRAARVRDRPRLFRPRRQRWRLGAHQQQRSRGHAVPERPLHGARLAQQHLPPRQPAQARLRGRRRRASAPTST